MITYNEAVNIIRSKIPEQAVISSVIEDTLAYEFYIVMPKSKPEDFSNNFSCSVNKETGETRNSSMLEYYELFNLEKYKDLLKTMKYVDDVKD